MEKQSLLERGSIKQLLVKHIFVDVIKLFAISLNVAGAFVRIGTVPAVEQFRECEVPIIFMPIVPIIDVDGRMHEHVRDVKPQEGIANRAGNERVTAVK